MDDKSIIELFWNRDESAIKETELKYGRRLQTISYGIVEDLPTAEECENDTYLRAWNTIPPNSPIDALFSYLARIIRNISIDVCRNKSRQKRSAKIVELSAEMEECIPSPSDVACKVEYSQLCEAIDRFLGNLSEEKQIVFIRRYWYMESVDSIADRLRIGTSKVKMILLRCRKNLKEYLIKEGYDL